MSFSLVVPSTAVLREAALALLYSPLPPGQREQQLADTLGAVERREFSLDNLVVALDGDRVVGTVLAVLRPGGAAFLWPPAVRAGRVTSEISTALLAAIAARLDAQGAQFTQCLLDPDDLAGRATLDRGGFPRATELILLCRSLAGHNVEPAGNLRNRAAPRDGKAPAVPYRIVSAGSAGASPSSLKRSDEGELAVECYSAGVHAAFSRIVERTYVETLDCPVLARIRGGEESLAAHRATGQFVPSAWRLYRRAGEDIGVLILAEHPDRDTWEVAYLGVVPEARGRGLGRAILHDGLALAQRSGRATIEIAVDSANTPALRLYHNSGFTEVRRFAVHLRVAPSPPPVG